jgi:F-type H+-transporting ATPase subunit delta
MTRVSAIARRYAQAYFELGQEAKAIEPWGDELRGVAGALSQPEVAAALVNPRLSMPQRTQLAMELLDGVSKPALNLARMLVERRRTRLVNEILAHYQLLTDGAQGIVRARVTTAMELDEPLEKQITQTLQEKFGSTVQTIVETDPAIIGGLVVRIGDRVVDDSIRTHLQQLQAALA